MLKASDTISFTFNSHIIQCIMKTLSNLQILHYKLTSSPQISCIVCMFLVTIRHEKQKIIDSRSRKKHGNLEEQVDLIRTTEVRKAAARFEVSTACVGVTLVHLFFHGLRQRTTIAHLRTQTHAANRPISVNEIVVKKSYFYDKIVGGWAWPQTPVR